MTDIFRRSSLSEWTWQILRRWWRRWRQGVDAAVNVERVEELVVRTADEAREEFIVDSGDTHYEVFLGQNCVKIIGRNHGRSDGEPENISNFLGNILIFYNTWDKASRRFVRD